MRLIDADGVREKMLKLLDHHLMMCNYSADSATQDCIEVINEATVVDAEPVRHGHWEKTNDGAAYCTSCKRKLNNYVYGYPRCPMCGARMDEVSK